MKNKMDDLISRQAALDAMETWDKFGCDPDSKLVRCDNDKHYIPYVHYEDMVHAIKHLPSAQPERRKGKWDFMGWQMFQCSECKHTFTQDFLEGWRGYTYEPFFPPFCPNCGADMRGEQDE